MCNMEYKTSYLCLKKKNQYKLQIWADDFAKYIYIWWKKKNLYSAKKKKDEHHRNKQIRKYGETRHTFNVEAWDQNIWMWQQHKQEEQWAEWHLPICSKVRKIALPATIFWKSFLATVQQIRSPHTKGSRHRPL